MKKIILLFVVIIVIQACVPKFTGNPDRFKQGVFSIPAGDSYSETIIERIDSLQIESYTKYISITTDSGVFKKEELKKDTLFITWKNNFFYTLKMKSPKTDLDKDPIFVQIKKISDSSYTFSAKIGFSKFIQEGVVYKIK